MSCVRFLDQHGINYRLYRHDQTFDAQHTAQVLHVPGKSVAKTVMARTRGGSRYSSGHAGEQSVFHLHLHTQVVLAYKRCWRAPGDDLAKDASFGPRFFLKGGHS
jgi:hypothetical protein